MGFYNDSDLRTSALFQTDAYIFLLWLGLTICQCEQ